MQLTPEQVDQVRKHLKTAELELRKAHALAAEERSEESGALFDLSVAIGARLFVWERLHGLRKAVKRGPERGEAEA